MSSATRVLALWFAGIYPKSRYPMIGVGLLVMGIVIEGLQGAMNVGRQADLRDVYANSLGIVAGLTLALVVARRLGAARRGLDEA